MKYPTWCLMFIQNRQSYFIKGSYLITGITFKRTFDRNKQWVTTTSIEAQCMFIGTLGFPV